MSEKNSSFLCSTLLNHIHVDAIRTQSWIEIQWSSILTTLLLLLQIPLVCSRRQILEWRFLVIELTRLRWVASNANGLLVMNCISSRQFTHIFIQWTCGYSIRLAAHVNTVQRRSWLSLVHVNPSWIKRQRIPRFTEFVFPRPWARFSSARETELMMERVECLLCWICIRSSECQTRRLLLIKLPSLVVALCKFAIGCQNANTLGVVFTFYLHKLAVISGQSIDSSLWTFS